MTARPVPARRSVAKVALTASAGAAIEWHDFFIYGAVAALVFPRLFFPADLPPLMAQIAAFSTFAVGFIARPIGGVVFGHFGDLLGRKRALSVALLVMGVATTCVGLLPGYATAGVLAPLALVVLRFIQGLAVGGQWGGAALLAIESAPEHRRTFGMQGDLGAYRAFSGRIERFDARAFRRQVATFVLLVGFLMTTDLGALRVPTVARPD